MESRSVRLDSLPCKLLGLTLALAITVSCSAPSIRADIQAYANSNLSMEAMESFSYQAADHGAHTLRDQALYEQVRDLLSNRGFHESSGADFQVTLQTDTKETTIEYPAHYEMGPHLYGGFSHNIYVSGADGKMHPTLAHPYPRYRSSPYRVPGRSVPAFAHHLALDFRAANGELLWQGTIDLVHRSRDFSGLMKQLIPELLIEFPAPSGLGIERRVEVKG